MWNRTYNRMLSGVAVAGLAACCWVMPAQAQDPVSSPTSRAKIAALLNLSPWRSWVHLFCDRTAPACSVTFWCGQRTGDPVTWNVEVEAGRIFTYYPNQMEEDGSAADLQSTLMTAGLPPDLVRRRTTCIVRSNDPVEARAYTYIAGQIVPVANVKTPTASADFAPTDPRAVYEFLVGKRLQWDDPQRGYSDFDAVGRFRQTTPDGTFPGSYTYEKTGPNRGTGTLNYDGVDLTCTVHYVYTSSTSGSGTFSCSDGRSGGLANWWIVGTPTE